MSRVTIIPSKVSGKIVIPPSKSLLHRAIICAALSNGTSIIENITLSDDILATISTLINLGAKIHILNNKLEISGMDFKNILNNNLNVFESGSTLRFIIPLLSLFDNEFVINLSDSLFNRPLDVYEKIYNDYNLKFIKEYNKIIIGGKLDFSSIEIDGSKSSQFASGLLFLMPLFNHDSKLIINNLESTGYVSLTLDMLSKFGIKYINNDYKEIFIYGNQKYNNTNVLIDGDYTHLANFLALGTINNDICVTGFSFNSNQYDKELVSKLNNIFRINGGYLIKKDDNLLLNEFDIKDNPDIALSLSVLFSINGGIIKNVNRLIYKESNRLDAIINELRKFNVNIRKENNDLIIERCDDLFTNDVINTYNDHRVFMAFSILATICKYPVTFDNYECISKSYPNYLDDLRKLGVSVIYEK